MLLILFLSSCKEQKHEPVVTPWGQIIDSVDVTTDMDLHQIQSNGELIIAAMSGPETVYDYHGHQMGAQYMLFQRLATRLGVRLRVDVCRDSTEMKEKLACGDVDLIAWNTPGQYEVSPDKPLLLQEIQTWYKPEMVAEVKKEEAFLLSTRSVKRRVFSPMLDKKGGIISHYDGMFMTYSRNIRWDWRLMAAQCYQESTFDPKAKSWAGACGLMQIMPSTADHLGLSREKLFDPESNIAAAAKYLGELEGQLSDVADRTERTNFVLASYNGGIRHIRDAMELARSDGRNPHRWRDVSEYVLKLATPEYYNKPVVKHGYMRGSETVDYVERIRQRYRGYMGVKSVSTDYHQSKPRKAEKRKKKYDV